MKMVNKSVAQENVLKLFNCIVIKYSEPSQMDTALVQDYGIVTDIKMSDELNVKYVVDKQEDVCYDYNMDYENFSYDKLEEFLLFK